MKHFYLLIPILCISSYATAQPQVHIIGAMKDVMWSGELAGKIHLDTISDKQHLYGLGPVEYLAGEILIIDGRCYRSSVVNEMDMEVEETFDLKAPFLGYANVAEWTEQSLPETVTTIADLESFVNKRTVDAARPFFFKVKGKVNTATIHIVNLPAGSTVSSPDEAHQGLTKYVLENEDVEVIGFFSTDHQSILTHHDTYVHLHLITPDRKKMGHLDEVEFEGGSVLLYLPKS